MSLRAVSYTHLIEYDENEYHFPFTIGNTGEYADTVDINVDKSSQFLSALLISAIVMEKNFTINVTGTPVSYTHLDS